MTQKLITEQKADNVIKPLCKKKKKKDGLPVSWRQNFLFFTFQQWKSTGVTFSER